jgi:anaerobic magnesium-protoporphyrin IX monomethyl ester cyclase
MKKTVLIAAPPDYSSQEELSLHPPLGILALGSFLAAHGVPVELIDVQTDLGVGLTREAERIVSQRVAQYLRDQGGELSWVGISQLSNGLSGILMAEEIHTALPDVPLVLGGYFATAMYRSLLQQYPFITAVVRGDGEAAALQISRCLAQGCSFLSEQTPNLVWRDGDRICFSPPQPVPLDRLPIMDFRLLRHPANYRVSSVVSSRGCPFRCNYCLEPGMRPYASHSPAWLEQQLAHLEAESLNGWIVFSDPIFGVNHERTRGLCKVMRGRRFAYALESRVDVLTPDLIPVLRAAGVEAIFWGVESASPATLLRMNKVHSAAQAEAYLEKARVLFKACFEHDVTPLMGVMAAFPGDTETDLQITVEFVREMSQLSNEIATQCGVESGFVPTAQPTTLFDGAPLAGRLAEEYPEVIVQRGPLEWERTIVSPSPGLDPDVIGQYLKEIEGLGHYSPGAQARLERIAWSSMHDFVEAHPEATDEQGVTTFW